MCCCGLFKICCLLWIGLVLKLQLHFSYCKYHYAFINRSKAIQDGPWREASETGGEVCWGVCCCVGTLSQQSHWRAQRLGHHLGEGVPALLLAKHGPRHQTLRMLIVFLYYTRCLITSSTSLLKVNAIWPIFLRAWHIVVNWFNTPQNCFPELSCNFLSLIKSVFLDCNM